MSFFEANPELLVPFREGKREVLELVYRAHVRSVERFLHALARRYGVQECVRHGALADLLQETFIRALSPVARVSFDGARDFGSYVKAIARNCLIDSLRAAGREMFETIDESLVEEAAEPACYIEPDVRAVLVEYLGGLPEQLSGVYVQRFVLGNSQDDACKALGLTRRQLRTQEDRLRLGLRRALQRVGVLRGDIRSTPMKFRPSR